MNFKCVKKYDKSYDSYVMLTTAVDFKIPEFFDKTVEKGFKELVKRDKSAAEKSKTFELNILDGEKVVNISLVYLGDEKKLDAKKIREAIYSGIKNITGKTLIIPLDKKADDIDAVAEVVENINYRYEKYLSEKNDKFLEAAYLTEKKSSDKIEGYELAKISNIVKDLINEQAEIMTPKELANQAVKLGKKFGFEVEILDEKQAHKLGMDSYLSVARAAHHRPYVTVMRYKGNPDSNYTYGLVGKGLTYDTGGLSLKSSAGMMGMKEDMGGAATMIGAMCSIAAMKLEKNVTCVVAACENSIGPNAYRPGDIVKTMNGKTVEVTNTDAEGRLTLVDALTYIIREEKADEIIDAATLTGAVISALGENITGLFTNDNDMAREFIAASENWHEYFWQMPMYDFFKKNLKSKVADLQNTGAKYGGAVNAAKFLEEFVEDKKWIHLDIAGTVFAHSPSSYYKFGPTGEVFRTIYTYIKNNK